MTTQEYDLFRSQLLDLAAEFDEAAIAYPPLMHQWVWGDEKMKGADWQAFIRANSRPDGDWQEWSVVPRRMRCARFHGFDDGLDEFLRLAKRGYALLTTAKDWIKANTASTSGVVLRLPKETGQHGWAEAVYLTARRYATALLSERSAYWAISGQSTDEETASWTVTQTGEQYPDHPAYEELVHDIFRSSAEAIRLWLAPSQVVTVGEVLESLDQIVLPPAFPAVPPPAQKELPETIRPVWTTTGELWVGRYLVKKFLQEAANQRAVLTAFQEDNWQRRIDDPIPPSPGLEPKRRLRETVDALNAYHKMTGLIRFGTDGTGKGVIWRFGDRAAYLLDNPLATG